MQGFGIWFVPFCAPGRQHLQLWRAACTSYCKNICALFLPFFFRFHITLLKEFPLKINKMFLLLYLKSFCTKYYNIGFGLIRNEDMYSQPSMDLNCKAHSCWYCYLLYTLQFGFISTLPAEITKYDQLLLISTAMDYHEVFGVSDLTLCSLLWYVYMLLYRQISLYIVFVQWFREPCGFMIWIPCSIPPRMPAPSCSFVFLGWPTALIDINYVSSWQVLLLKCVDLFILNCFSCFSFLIDDLF